MEETIRSVTELLEQTAIRLPDKTAVTDPQGSITYRELTAHAKAAGSFIAAHASFGSPVVLFVEKSKEAVALLFGTLYAGCFYSFISKDQPASRLGKILNRISPALIIAEKEDFPVLEEALQAEHQEKTILPEMVSPKEVFSASVNPEGLEEIRGRASLSDRLYATFTSGSTGEPKGVVVSHQAVVDFSGHFTETFGIRESDRIGNQAPFDFDVSVKDIYSAIRTGATLVLIPRSYFSMTKELLDYLCVQEVSVLIWAVSAMCMISGLKGFTYRIPEKIRLVMFSGEVMPVKHLKIWQEALKEAEFVNLYGPSEITCNCTYYRIPENETLPEKLPIGIPFEGREIYLVDQTNRIIGRTGETGEICVSGESLAEGYYRDPLRTEKSFCMLDVPEQKKKVRIYRTGDLGYFGEDGLLYFGGRADSQIKHMGHRIELGEVEHAMLENDGVSRVCCIFSEEKNRIFGFYVGETDETSLRMRMKEYLPVYMIPTRLIRLEQFRLNKNGKIDRSYLKEKYIEKR